MDHHTHCDVLAGELSANDLVFTRDPEGFNVGDWRVDEAFGKFTCTEKGKPSIEVGDRFSVVHLIKTGKLPPPLPKPEPAPEPVIVHPEPEAEPMPIAQPATAPASTPTNPTS